MSRDDARAAPVSVDVHVRPSRIAEALDEYVVELQHLEADGVVDEVSVSSWPGRVPVRSSTGEAVEQFERFRAWADDHDVSIQPPFSVHTVDSAFTGEHRTYLSTPVLCLAVEADDALAGVYPHTDGDEHHTVADGVAALADGELLPAGTGKEAPKPNVCADCGGQVVNVQGIRTCHDCRAVDRRSAPSRPAVASR